MTKTKPDQILLDDLQQSVAAALAEDVGGGDLSAALVPADRQSTARVVSRQGCILCGQAWFDEVYRQIDRSIEINWLQTDGEQVTADTVVCELSGSARTLSDW